MGQFLYASRNGYLTSAENSATNNLNSEDTLRGQHDGLTGASFGDATQIGVVTIVPDATHDELLFDLRI
jgi:hypothetical protein